MVLGPEIRWMLFWEFSLINFSLGRNSLAVQCPGLSAPTPEAQAQLLFRKPKFHKMFHMSIKVIKTNRHTKNFKKITKNTEHTHTKKKKKKEKEKNTSSRKMVK